jgi:ABC-type phosphate/phosphonate transport system ATPase subunit
MELKLLNKAELTALYRADLVRDFPHRVITLEKGHIVADTGRPATVTLGQMADVQGGVPV